MNCLAILLVFIGMFYPISLNATQVETKKHSQAVAFYYGQQLPIQEAAFYPAIVVQANHVDDWQIKWLQNRGTKVYAYLSVGESTQLPANTEALGQNTQWQSYIPNLEDNAWQTYLFQNAQTLLQQYDGLFLDTLDSYQLTDKTQHSSQKNALIHIIQTLGQLSHGNLILNRGFDLLPQLRSAAHTVIAEGLFTHYSPLQNTYKNTTESDQAWLLKKLNDAKSLGFTVQVLDYAESPKLQANIAQKIIDQQFLPWVSDGQLNQWGTGTLQTIPRKVAVLFNSQNSKTGSTSQTTSHKRLDSHLEFLGYIPQYIDISQPLDHDIDPAITAGIVAWADNNEFYNKQATDWLYKQLAHTKVLLIGEPPNDQTLLSSLGLTITQANTAPYSVAHIAPEIKSESPLNWQGQYVYNTQVSTNTAEVLFSLYNKNKQKMPQITRTQYGAIALNPWVIDTLPNKLTRWYINPTTLLQQGLQLPAIPAPDVTTENGKRILVNHIDGDGFPSRSYFSHKKRVSQLVYEDIIKAYPIPITVSVIEGEIGPTGLYPKQSKELEDIAREIFRLPYVEMASHSFSHPFFWPDKNGQLHISKKDTLYGYHLPIKNYTLDQKREVEGSINYINRELAPEGKRVEVMLWTGKAIVSTPSLIAARNAGVVNVNGGNSYTNPATGSLSEIWPIGRHIEQDLYQIYAPVMNENVFTHDWTGEFGGFRNVIKTFKNTDKPQRLKPMNIYYHFYSGTYPASLNALKAIYHYALAQKPSILYLSDYAKRAQDFYDSAIAKDLNGQWLIQSKHLKTLRIPKALGYPNINNTVAGFNIINGDAYLHLSQNNPSFSLTKQKPTQAYLLQANITLQQWHTQQNAIHTQFKAYTPIEFYMASSTACRFYTGTQVHHFKHTQTGQKLELKPGQYQGRIHCESGP